MKTLLSYQACFYPSGDGGYVVEVPDLPGCVTGGDSLAEAILMAVDAASGWVLDELESGKPFPKASEIGAIVPNEGGFISMIALDMDEYAAKYGEKAVRKNVTIPAWQATYGDKHNLNYSQLLQQAINDHIRNND